MVGVTVSAAGPSFVNAADGAPWIVPVSWILQVMPLFFVIGGFSGATALRSMRQRDGDATTFVVARVRRLLRPAAATIGAVGTALAVLAAAGVAPDLVRLAGYGSLSRSGSSGCSSCARRSCRSCSGATTARRGEPSRCSSSPRWPSTSLAT